MGLDISLKEELQKMDEKYGDQMYKMYGPTLLTWAGGIDSSRLYMFTSHLKQFLTLLNPDVPRIQTGFENTIGEVSKAFKRLEGTWEVKDKIYKYNNPNSIYTLVLYNKKTDTYDMIEKIVAESCTEKFGYLYNTQRMDETKPGDILKDEVLYKSTSYDDNMNYRYGKNAKVYYSTSNDTLEDAIIIRKSWADKVKSVEVDMVQVPINDNDILLNLYGDDDNYKSIPDIGEMVLNSTLCATRRINKKHLLYDFQSHNMQEIYDTDEDYFVSKDSVVYDIDIYYNKDEPFPDNIFYKQLKEYYNSSCEYADKMYKWATEIKESGSKYTDNVTYFRSKYKNFNDPEYKWKNRDKAFSNIIIEFKVKAIVSLDSGSKISGRYGNKGVISEIKDDTRRNITESLLGEMSEELTDEEKERLSRNIEIVDDEKMPYTDDGPIDIILNASGVTRRLISEPMYEVELNFIGEELRKKIVSLNSIEEKEDIIFNFLRLINKEEYEFFYEMYDAYDRRIEIDGKTIRLMNQSAKERFIKDVEENGFYLRKYPHSSVRFETLREIYKEFDFIKPLPLYIDIFGTKKRRIIKDGIVGEQYMIILKQNSNKNFSARSTYRINRANLPTKDNAKTVNRSSYAKTPIRLSEIYNLMSAISGRTLAEYNIFMRSSILGRKSLDSIIATEGNPLAIKKLKIHDNFINANADILNARLKSIGLKLKFVGDNEEETSVLTDVIMPLYIDKYIIYDTPLNKHIYNKLFYYFKQYLRNHSIVETHEGEKEELAWKYVFELDDIKEMNISDSIKDIVLNITTGNKDYNLNEITEDIPEEDISDSSEE